MDRVWCAWGSRGPWSWRWPPVPERRPPATSTRPLGRGGEVTTDLGFGSRGFSVALQPDGKIIVGGTAASNFALARYQPDGSLDPDFDGDGIVTTALGGSAQVFAVALQADGKIVAAGTTAPEATAARSRSPATTRMAASTRPSMPTAS